MDRRVKTPCFIIDKKTLDNNIKILQESTALLRNNVIIGYSVKTNSLPFLIEYFNKLGLFIEVVSFDEYEYVKSLNIDCKNIIYNGPIKNKKTFLEAVINDSIVNIDSYRELRWLLNSEIVNKNIGIRINLPIDKELYNIFEYPESGSRFGFSIYDTLLKKLLNELSNKKNIKVTGIHFHCNTVTRDALVYKKMIDYAEIVVEKLNLNLKYIDLGGGFLGGNKKTFQKYISLIKNTLLKYEIFNNASIVIEPGAALIATAVSYYTKVVDTKIIDNIKIVTIDGSRTHIDPTFSNKKYIYETSCKKKSERKNIICGFSCMERDRITLDMNLDLSVGDYFIFKNLGAYTMTFLPNFIFSYPSVYLKENDFVTIIRKKRKLERFLK